MNLINCEFFPLSLEQWTIKGNIGFFISQSNYELFSYDFSTQKLDFISNLPIKAKGFKLYGNCININNKIFCFPYYGDHLDVLIYDMSKNKWGNIKYNMFIKEWRYPWIEDDIIYIISLTQNLGLISINTRNNSITYDMIHKGSENDQFYGIIKNKKQIVCVQYNRPVVYVYDRINRVTNSFIFDNEKGFSTVAGKDNRIWLSGYKRDINYLDLRVEKKILKKIRGIPKEFGVYDFQGIDNRLIDFDSNEYANGVFIDAIYTDDEIWYIPLYGNKILIYDITRKVFNTFEIQNEEENERSLNNRIFNAKYGFTYFREHKYIGLYSYKNQKIIEINIKTKDYKYLKFDIDISSVKLKNEIIDESVHFDKIVFLNKIGLRSNK